MALSHQINWYPGIIDAYYALGANELTLGEYNVALAHYDSSLQFNNSYPAPGAAIKLYISIGDTYVKLSRHNNAAEYYFKALKLAEKENRKNDIATCYTVIGDIFKTSGDYKKALNYFERSADIFRATNDNIGLSATLKNIGNVWYALGDLKKAGDYYQLSLKTAEQTNDERLITETLVNISIVYSDNGDYENSLNYAFRALELYRRANNRGGISNILGNIGTTYLQAADAGISINSSRHLVAGKVQNIRKAIGYLKESIDLAKELGDLGSLPQFYENLSEGYVMIGDYQNAYKAHTDYTLYKDSAERQQQSREIATRALEYEFTKQSDSIKVQKLLAEERLSFETYARKKEKIIFISGILLLVGVAIFILRSLRIQQKLNKTIKKLVAEQERTIEKRTADLRISNDRLRDLISFNAHQIREPLTRITGAIQVREYVDQDEYFNDFLPQMEKAALDLDNAIKDVLSRAQENEQNPS